MTDDGAAIERANQRVILHELLAYVERLDRPLDGRDASLVRAIRRLTLVTREAVPVRQVA